MCEFLIKVFDNPVPDGPGRWYGAQIVTCQEDSHGWGRKEGLPDFYILRVPGLAVATANQYIEDWRHIISYNIDSSDNVTDTHTITLSSSRVSAGGVGALSLAQVDGFLARWAAVRTGNTNDSVTFTANILDAITSNGIWGDASQFTFNETNYDSGTGEHTVEVLTGSSPEQVQRGADRYGFTYVSGTTFIAERSVVRGLFQDDVKQALESIGIARRRFRITNAGMTALQGAGGEMTVTIGQLTSNLRDMLAE